MAMKLEELEGLMKAIGYRYLRDPDHPMLVSFFKCEHGSFQILLRLDLDGQYLHIRAPSLLRCPKDHRHLPALFAALTSMNSQCRSVKYAWDAGDGEVAASTDAWPMDGKLTPLQLQRLIDLLLVTVDGSSPSLQRVLDTGDPAGAAAPGTVTHL